MGKIKSMAIVGILIGIMTACTTNSGDEVDRLLAAYQGDAVPGAA